MYKRQLLSLQITNKHSKPAGATSRLYKRIKRASKTHIFSIYSHIFEKKTASGSPRGALRKPSCGDPPGALRGASGGRTSPTDRGALLRPGSDPLTLNRQRSSKRLDRQTALTEKNRGTILEFPFIFLKCRNISLKKCVFLFIYLRSVYIICLLYTSPSPRD